MASNKASQNITELEFYYHKYFDTHIAPLADKAVKAADAAFVKEFGEMVDSKGVLGNVAVPGSGAIMTYAQSTTLDSYQNYWTNIQKSFSKQFEASASIKADLGHLIDNYQQVLVEKMGKERYQQESQKYGQDLATWYVNNKLLEWSLNRMASHGAPKNATEYLLKKGSELSLFGLFQPSDWEGMRTLQEQQYNPSKAERLAAYGVGGVMDFVIMPVGGMKTALVGTAAGAGIDIVFSSGKNQVSIDKMMSRSVFGNSWELAESRKGLVDAGNSNYLKRLNTGMKKQVSLPKMSPFMKDMFEKSQFTPSSVLVGSQTTDDIPSVIAPGMEELYKKEQEQIKKRNVKTTPKPVLQATSPVTNSVASSVVNPESVSPAQSFTQQSVQQVMPVNNTPWGGMLSQFGLSGFSDVFKNLGYVLAMLPDMMIGMFTGKTKSLSVQNNLMPIAAIVMGMFVKNPLLKMLLIGLGGANLLNKATHEALGVPTGSQQIQYRKYADEQLNARISHPMLNGNLLVATIDGVPSTVTLQNHVVDAYQKGALPLNTLANAVLAKYDEQRLQVEENYNLQMSMDEEQIQTRGIK